MKSEQIQTAAIVIAAMLLGSGLTYWMLREKTAPVPSPAAGANAGEAVTSILPPPGGLEAQWRRRTEALDDAQFAAAMSRARAARQAGTLKPLATTADEFAAALGALNYRIHDFSVRYVLPAPDGSPEAEQEQREMQQLLEELANLLSDDALLAKLDESTPAEMARAQSQLVAGTLGLDVSTAKKVEAILLKAYAEVMPADLPEKTLTLEEEAALDQKLEAMNEKMIAEIQALLSPEQRERFEAMGADQVLFGLRGEE